MHESRIAYRELAQSVFWKPLEGFQGNTLGHSGIRESEILLKRATTTGVSYLGKYFLMAWTFTFDVFQFLTKAISFSCYHL